MANLKLLEAIHKRGLKKALEEYRQRYPESSISLKGEDLSGVDFKGANLEGVNLSYADLRNADLRGVDLSKAITRFANLEGAKR